MKLNLKFIKILDLSRKIFPYLFVATFSLLLIESFTYLGFIRKFFLVDSRFFLVISILIFSLYKISTIIINNGDEYLSRLVVGLNKIFVGVIFLFYIILQIEETRHFNNYIFSTFHIQPNIFFNVLIFSLLTVFIDIGIDKNILTRNKINNFICNYKTNRSNVIRFASFVLLFFFLGTYILNNLSKTLDQAIKSNIFVLSHLNYNYDQKMYQVWGFYHEYMKFVKENTPSDANILIPPQETPWLSEGNVNLSRYFVYPRRLYNGEIERLNLKSIDYVLITWGSWQTEDKSKYGWPNEKIDADEILMYDVDSKTVSKIETDYDPDDIRFLNGWGIIKLKK